MYLKSQLNTNMTELARFAHSLITGTTALVTVQCVIKVFSISLFPLELRYMEGDDLLPVIGNYERVVLGTGRLTIARAMN